MSKNNKREVYIKDLLLKIADSEFESAEKIISNAFLFFLENNQKMSLEAISKKANYSKSSIVKFCKKLGFDGFNDFFNALKYQLAFNKNNNQWIEKEFLDIDLEFHNKINKIFNSIRKQISEIEWISLNIKKHNSIFICTSKENVTSGMILNDFFQTLNLKSHFSFLRSEWIYPNHFQEGDLIIFLMSGMETKSFKKVYDLAIKNGVETFVICSESQTQMFKETKHKIVLSYDIFFPWFHGHNLIVDYVLNFIFYSINHVDEEFYILVYS